MSEFVLVLCDVSGALVGVVSLGNAPVVSEFVLVLCDVSGELVGADLLGNAPVVVVPLLVESANEERMPPKSTACESDGVVELSGIPA